MSMTIQPLSKITIFLHWLVAICFMAMLAVGSYMVDLPRGSEKGELYGLHKSMGVLIFVLVVIRITWRLKEGRLPPISQQRTWQERMATGIHHFFYLATLLMPVSGIMMSVGGGRGLSIFSWNLIPSGERIDWLGTLGGQLHSAVAYALYFAIILHIIGALKHHFVLKDGLLKRMLTMTK